MIPDWRWLHGRRTVATLVITALVVTAIPAAVAMPVAADDRLGPNAVTYLTHSTVIDDPGVYILRTDVSATGGDGITVTADDVTIYGAGHSLVGSPDAGSAIIADGVSNLHVEGVAISGWWNGLTLSNVDGATITDVHVTNTSGDGLRITDSVGVSFASGSVVNATGHGVVVTTGRDITVANADLTDNLGHGVAMRDSRASTVHANTIANNGGVGVRVDTVPERAPVRASLPFWMIPLYGDVPLTILADLLGDSSAVTDSQSIVVTNNVITDNRYEGVLVIRAAGGTIADNTISNATDGIHLYSVSKTTVAGNTVSGSTDDGIALSWVNDSSVSGNTMVDNRNDGLYLFGDRNTLRDNTASENGDDGIDVDSGVDNLIESNAAHGNGDDGVFVREANVNSVLGNDLRNNADDGIDLRGSTGNSVGNNTVCGSTDRDVQIRQGVVGNDVFDNNESC